MHYVSSEALLEMYFLQGTLKELAKMFGAGSLRLIKPSPQDEKWVGIDQAWVASSFSDKQFLEHLKKTVSVGSAAAPFYFAVFRQYKRVEKITKASIYTPYVGTSNQWNQPYLRCDIYTEPGVERDGRKTSGSKKATLGQPKYSQHEALIRLSALPNADVQYACPMIFGPLDIWKQPNMNDVRLVSVKPSHPTYSKDGKKHHLCFRIDTDPNPEFHSAEGIGTDSSTFASWLDSLQSTSKQLKAQELLTTLLAAERLLDPGRQPHSEDIAQVMSNAAVESEKIWHSEQPSTYRLAHNLSHMLTVIEISHKK